MTKTSLTRALLAAGALALAGAAQADAIFYPDGRVVELGEGAAEQLVLNEDGSIRSAATVDTTVLGGPAAVTTTTTAQPVTVTRHVYVQPNIDFDRHAVLAQMQRPPHEVVVGPQTHVLGAGAAPHDDKNFNVPARAGEASTMTHGAPNLVTSNQSFVVGGTIIPHSALVVGQPYYVLSY